MFLLPRMFPLCLLLAASVWGYMYYQTEYLQTVNGITIEEGLSGLIVHVDSQAREELLSVVCTDPYGNSFTQNVRNGQAEFTKLTPGTFYTIQVQVSGLHKLSEPVSQVYTTEGTTNVAALNAGVGPQDGSVTLSMIVEGCWYENSKRQQPCLDPLRWMQSPWIFRNRSICNDTEKILSDI